MEATADTDMPQNRALAQLLTAQGVPSDYEQRTGRKQMDVVANVECLRVPDFTAMGTAELESLNSWFNWLQEQPLLPFPQMAEDVARRQIDDAIIEALRLDADWVATIRQELAREPSVRDKRL